MSMETTTTGYHKQIKKNYSGVLMLDVCIVIDISAISVY